MEYIFICSGLAVVGMIWIKEFKIKANWEKIPRSFRFVWWFIFAINSIGICYFIESLF